MRLFGVSITLVLIAFAAAACDETLPSATESARSDVTTPLLAPHAGQSGPAASGHINVTFAGALQTISFHAREARNGSVRGSFEVFARAPDMLLGMHGALDCLEVDGNVAVVSGHVTHGKKGFGTEGQAWVWAVRDNGEGQAVDEWTDVLFAGFEPWPDLCHAFSAEELFEFGHAYSEGGNVQVKP